MRLRRLVLLLAILSLLTGCRKAPPRPPFLELPEPPAPPSEMGLSVRADFSALTPYVPQHVLYSRLHDGPLPELIPSDTYGMLLPYASAVVTQDGSLYTSKAGFVTIDGTVVTDLVYSRVDRAYNYNYYSPDATPLPAYRLTVDLPYNSELFYGESRQGACAIDGSWVTAVDYMEVVFAESVFFLFRDYFTYDIEVRDYTGKVLYNISDFDWTRNISEDEWPGSIAHSSSAGYSFIRMNDGKYAAIEAKTGAIRYTEYTAVGTFCEGLAPVIQSYDPYLWGYINTEFRLVIQPRYVYPSSFVNGRAVVETPNGIQHVIDKRGDRLFSVDTGQYLEQQYDGAYFLVHSTDTWEPTYYTNEFIEIKLPDNKVPNAYLTTYDHMEGWFSCETDGGMLLFSSSEEYLFPDAGYIDFTDGRYVIYTEYTDKGFRKSVTGLDGQEILPMKDNESVDAVKEGGMVKAFIVNTQQYRYFGSAEYTPSTYRLFGTDGTVLSAGGGRLSYDPDMKLYSVLAEDYSAWLDAAGKTIISIPLMSYTVD